MEVQPERKRTRIRPRKTYMDNLDMIARTNGMGVTELRETAGDIRLEEIN